MSLELSDQAAAEGDARLRLWRENVGRPLACDFAAAGADDRPAGGDVLIVLSWNVWIGRGRLADVVGRLRDGAYERVGALPGAPLVVLVQEAFREDDSVPTVASAWTSRQHPRDFHPLEDIRNVAIELDLNLRYAPSMRNGSHRSDRGNAILSSLPLQEATAFELPFVVQRRVAVGATVSATRADGSAFHLRVYSAHLDPWGASPRDWLGVAGRARQASRLLEMMEAPPHDSLPLVLGADLNTSRGRREAAYRVLAEAGFAAAIPARDPAWGHTYHMVPRLAIDYLLFRPSAGPAAAAVHRLNEHPRDAGPTVFGSDHHPLLGVVELEHAAEPAP